MLDEGTTDPEALAVKLTDPAWKNLSAAFGFGDDEWADRRERLRREDRRGLQDARLRDRRRQGRRQSPLGDELQARDGDPRERGREGASWFEILGSKPLREVFETAFGLPSGFVNLDIDRQRDIIAAKTDKAFGGDTLAVFADPEVVEKMISHFLARAQMEQGAVSASSPALTLLQSINGCTSGLFNLLASKS